MGFSIAVADAEVYSSGSADGRYVLPIFLGRYLEMLPFVCMLKCHTNNKWMHNISKLNIY